MACVRSGVCSSAQRGRDAVALAGSETGTAHGRGGPYRVECRFSLRFCGFLIYVKATCRAPVCAQGVCAHGSATTSLDDTSRALEFQRKLAFTPSDRLSPMCEPASHSPPKGPGNRSGRWRSGHPAGFEGPAGHDRADRAQCLLGSAFPRSGIAVGSPPGCCRVGSQQTGMLTQSPSRTLVRAQGPGDCGSVSQHCPSDLGPLRAPGSVAPGRAGRSGLRGALRGAAESGVDEDEDEDEDQDRTPDGDGQDG